MSRLVLPATLALLAAFAMTAPSALAVPGAVKGASCKACHVSMPAKKTNLNPKAAVMLKAHKKVANCKNCHGAAAGKLTVTKAPAKGAPAKK